VVHKQRYSGQPDVGDRDTPKVRLDRAAGFVLEIEDGANRQE